MAARSSEVSAVRVRPSPTNADGLRRSGISAATVPYASRNPRTSVGSRALALEARLGRGAAGSSQPALGGAARKWESRSTAIPASMATGRVVYSWYARYSSRMMAAHHAGSK
jgi:hypothetical protein